MHKIQGHRIASASIFSESDVCIRIFNGHMICYINNDETVTCNTFLLTLYSHLIVLTFFISDI